MRKAHQRLLGTYITCCAQFGESGGHGKTSGCTKLSVPPTTAQLTFRCTTWAHQFLRTNHRTDYSKNAPIQINQPFVKMQT